ncbi:outer membrane beta-barrel protein [Rhodoflexus caldus]|uniref:outer membrane beta-barrel protein n=1 Tax=Rhodoflexus caldus TaxID=2891236 RepID=UPI00202A4ACC|nr:outer membrane beta-barrel protein [Rhodoflexus caldus]
MYNLKKVCFIFLFALYGTIACAQVTLMPRVGGSMTRPVSNYTDDFYVSEELNFSWGAGFSAGMDILIPISGGFSVQPGIGIARKTGKVFYKGVSRSYTHTHDIKGSGFFIEPSALLRFDLDADQRNSSLYFVAGPTLSIIAGGSVDDNYLMVTNRSNQIVFSENKSALKITGLESQEIVQPLGLSGIVGIGYRLSLGGIAAFADVRYQHGLMSYVNGKYFQQQDGWDFQPTLRKNTLALNFGIALPLGK